VKADPVALASQQAQDVGEVADPIPGFVPRIGGLNVPWSYRAHDYPILLVSGTPANLGPAFIS